jgi:hypothetical protein
VAFRFNPPPSWPKPPSGWTPPPGWMPDPSWPALPPGWQLWVAEDVPAQHPRVPQWATAPAPVAPQSAGAPVQATP